MATAHMDVMDRWPVHRIIRPFQEFVRAEVAGGVVLLISAVVALAWANSPWRESYFALWDMPVSLAVGGWQFAKPLHFIVDDILMTIFFFVVGLEIKRELLIGELASARKAALPIAAAIGGMLVPASIYLAFTFGTPASAGWGIPMATDIAFALGVLALLGSRIPNGLKVLLTALAIVDDIGAVLVIAIFYTSAIGWVALVVAVGMTALLIIAARLDIHHALVYFTLGLALWGALLVAGIHVTIAGVIVALAIPARARINSAEFVESSGLYLNDFDRAGMSTRAEFIKEEHQMAMSGLRELCKNVEAPAQRIEHTLVPWVAYVIMPLFALANAGVTFEGNFFALFSSPITLGVLLGLLVGKPLGIVLMTWLSIKLKWAELPPSVTPRQVLGIGFLAGIGFTMSLFITPLAFPESGLAIQAKEGILIAALAAGGLGWIVLRGWKLPFMAQPDEGKGRQQPLPEHEPVG
jgi:NhaA family Na+:H+ antiporter